MTRTMTTTIAALAALAWLPPSTGAAAAQEATAQEALEYLQRAERPNYAHLPAIAILRQASGPRTAAELDALADQVAVMVIDSTLPEDVRDHAWRALRGATDDGYEGTSYPRAFDLLVRVYEGGYDHALHTIWRAFPERGPAYVRELFERSERPPQCRWRYDGDRGWLARAGGVTLLDDPRPPPPPECEDYRYWDDAYGTPWCEAGSYLFRGIVTAAWERTPGGRRSRGAGYPAPVPEGLPEHVDDWHRRCR